ncbi:tocopherol cyclase family protein [Sedimentibacter sp.]|nr:tocopherol cyclase family protein [Sedimentibacter sp.]
MVLKYKKNPLIFQGKKKDEKYFEGWYFKHVSYDLKNIISIIPGISKNDADSHAFIQIIISKKFDGETLNTQYYKFSIGDFKYTDEPFCLTIRNNIFTNEGIELNLTNDEYLITGSIKFSEFTKINRTILSPDAMGYFSYLPFMECYHDIISMDHNLKGSISVNNKVIDFNEGKGYIEKDWGTSFPKEYIWLQSNHFDDTDASIMFSLAHIPFLGASFQGFICNLSFNGHEYRFATYNNSKIVKANYSESLLELVIVKGAYELLINSVICRDSGSLKAPINGAMDIIIKEGLTGSADIRLLKNSKILFEGKGDPCAIEVMMQGLR